MSSDSSVSRTPPSPIVPPSAHAYLRKGGSRASPSNHHAVHMSRLSFGAGTPQHQAQRRASGLSPGPSTARTTTTTSSTVPFVASSLEMQALRAEVEQQKIDRAYLERIFVEREEYRERELLWVGQTQEHNMIRVQHAFEVRELVWAKEEKEYKRQEGNSCAATAPVDGKAQALDPLTLNVLHHLVQEIAHLTSHVQELTCTIHSMKAEWDAEKAGNNSVGAEKHREHVSPHDSFQRGSRGTTGSTLPPATVGAIMRGTRGASHVSGSSSSALLPAASFPPPPTMLLKQTASGGEWDAVPGVRERSPDVGHADAASLPGNTRHYSPPTGSLENPNERLPPPEPAAFGAARIETGGCEDMAHGVSRVLRTPPDHALPSGTSLQASTSEKDGGFGMMEYVDMRMFVGL